MKKLFSNGNGVMLFTWVGFFLAGVEEVVIQHGSVAVVCICVMWFHLYMQINSPDSKD